ncbi:hypothetical protein INT45_005248 [Circinella minor]|uniref:SET domain-containing protein n=1 Tax=Circinella minor TaxID=1195481 RepID=A0A8H7S4R7_9FUNG|nr:hypothetical protein INT45_005248 [Circinella minor]
MSHLDDTILLHKRRGRTARRRTILAAMRNTTQEIRGKVVRDKTYDKFIDWLRQHNFPKTKMVLAEFPETGRGMMATGDIEPGEIIVSVPKKFLICNETLQKEYGQHPLTMHQLLALHICFLKRDSNSWWKPYIDLLPSHFNTMPVKYPKILADRLPTSLKGEVSQQMKRLESDYTTASRFLKSRNKNEFITYKEYEWAWLCGTEHLQFTKRLRISDKQQQTNNKNFLIMLNTRCIHMSTIDATAKGGNIAMAILLDFLNHSCNAKIESGFNVRTQCFEIRTLTPYKTGEQIFINYGPHDNLAILREYGFIIPDQNDFNFVSLDKEIWTLFDEMETARDSQLKKEILQKEGDYSIKKHEISFRLLSALRLLAIDGSHSRVALDQRYFDWRDTILGETDIISQDNERRVLIMLKSLCERVIESSDNEKTRLMEISSQDMIKYNIHNYALTFVKQIWRETEEIARMTILDIEQKLGEMI